MDQRGRNSWKWNARGENKGGPRQGGVGTWGARKSRFRIHCERKWKGLRGWLLQRHAGVSFGRDVKLER